jgi:hypothetical protein
MKIYLYLSQRRIVCLSQNEQYLYLFLMELLILLFPVKHRFEAFWNDLNTPFYIRGTIWYSMGAVLLTDTSLGPTDLARAWDHFRAALAIHLGVDPGNHLDPLNAASISMESFFTRHRDALQIWHAAIHVGQEEVEVANASSVSSLSGPGDGETVDEGSSSSTTTTTLRGVRLLDRGADETLGSLSLSTATNTTGESLDHSNVDSGGGTMDHSTGSGK